jgi:hypothetical protein
MEREERERSFIDNQERGESHRITWKQDVVFWFIEKLNRHVTKYFLRQERVAKG